MATAVITDVEVYESTLAGGRISRVEVFGTAVPVTGVITEVEVFNPPSTSTTGIITEVEVFNPAALLQAVLTGTVGPVNPGDVVSLSLAGSTDADTYAFTYTGVTPSSYTAAVGTPSFTGTGSGRTFVAPLLLPEPTDAAILLHFSGTITRTSDSATDTDTFDVQVLPHTMWGNLAGVLVPVGFQVPTDPTVPRVGLFPDDGVYPDTGRKPRI